MLEPKDLESKLFVFRLELAESRVEEHFRDERKPFSAIHVLVTTVFYNRGEEVKN